MLIQHISGIFDDHYLSNMADANPLSKSAKKNQKRRAAAAAKKKATSENPAAGFSVFEDIPPAATGSRLSPSPPPPLDPISALKLQIEEAKSAKDHDRAQALRQQLWILQDTVHLGSTGPGAPHTDVSSILPPPVPAINTKSQVQSSVSGNPTEKKLNKLRRKLQQIQALKERFAGGEQLESTQLAKIKSEDEIQDEISFLEKLLEQSQLK